jgi:hypothetical protein
VSEWFKEPVLKTGVRETVPWVRIPPLPPNIVDFIEKIVILFMQSMLIPYCILSYLLVPAPRFFKLLASRSEEFLVFSGPKQSSAPQLLLRLNRRMNSKAYRQASMRNKIGPFDYGLARERISMFCRCTDQLAWCPPRPVLC